jgi:hypothetical protein
MTIQDHLQSFVHREEVVISQLHFLQNPHHLYHISSNRQAGYTLKEMASKLVPKLFTNISKQESLTLTKLLSIITLGAVWLLDLD